MEQKPVTTPDQSPAQSFCTEGIKPMAWASLFARLFIHVVTFFERLNLTCSKVGNPPVYDAAVLPWTQEIEGKWPVIRALLDRILTRQADLSSFHEISADVATISQDRGRKNAFAIRLRLQVAANIKLCQQTWHVCQKIPSLITVMFSILEPGKYRPAHH